MIIQDLQSVVSTLRYDTVAPEFLYDMQGMENYTADNVPDWIVEIPIIEDRLNYDAFNERRYNLRCIFRKINKHEREMNEDSAYYQAIFDKLAGQQKLMLLRLDKIKDTQSRRRITVRSDEIRTLYRAQDYSLAVPCTIIEFNLPLTLHDYAGQCV